MFMYNSHFFGTYFTNFVHLCFDNIFIDITIGFMCFTIRQ
jgi:hypothetical protein